MIKTNNQLTSNYNRRLNPIQPAGIRAFDDQISGVEDLIKLTLGEPDLNTPEHIKAAGIKGITDNDSHYSASAGKIELRTAISKYLKHRFDLGYDEEEIVVTNGATQAINSVFQAIINPGDEVILPTPIFSLYGPIIEMLGGSVIEVDTSKTDFKLTPTLLENTIQANPGVVALVFNDPNNPTGVTYQKDEIIALTKVIKQHPIWVLSDEIYAELSFDDGHYSMANEIIDQVLYVNGLSKSHAMTGWRFGYVCGPYDIMQKIKMLNSFLVTCVADNVQDASLEALTNGQQDAIDAKAIYQHRRDLVIKHLNQIGVSYVMPKATFYCFIKIDDKYGNDDYQFCLDLAKQAGLGVIPGQMFGDSGKGYFRLSFAASEAKIENGLTRLANFIKQINN